MVVIGAGQSALESAALLYEAGADVEVLVRAPFVRWLWRHKWFHTFKPVARMLSAPADVGQTGLSHLAARPNLFRRLPRSIQDRWGKRAIRPAGAGWFNPRCQPIRITTSRILTSAVPEGGRLVLTLDDGTERHVDHALLATGYRVNIALYPFLSRPLLKTIATVNGSIG
ncbi:MAG TPA: hypothetical protein VF749_12895 [Candidatus Acidoferrum sp.]